MGEVKHGKVGGEVTAIWFSINIRDGTPEAEQFILTGKYPEVYSLIIPGQVHALAKRLRETADWLEKNSDKDIDIVSSGRKQWA